MRERLAELGCDPIEGMARIAMDLTTPVELRARMYAELASYVAPKRKAVEHVADPGTIAGFVMYGEPEMDDTDAWIAKHKPKLAGAKESSPA